jgi:hypothetical protein
MITISLEDVPKVEEVIILRTYCDSSSIELDQVKDSLDRSGEPIALLFCKDGLIAWIRREKKEKEQDDGM